MYWEGDNYWNTNKLGNHHLGSVSEAEWSGERYEAKCMGVTRSFATREDARAWVERCIDGLLIKLGRE